MRNQRGQMTVDFIFAIVLVLGFTGMLFIVSFTLSTASIVQYITYASARNYMLGHVDKATQEQRGNAKYDQLINNPVFKPLFKNGWYKIDASPTIGDNTSVNPSYAEATQGVNQFIGASTRFVAPVLDFHIPFFGQTVTDGQSGGEGFATVVGSYLGREPTEDECIQFTAARWEAIKRLPPMGGASPYSTAASPASSYAVMTDDGC